VKSDALKEILLKPVLQPFRELVNADMFKWIINNRWGKEKSQQYDADTVLEEVSWKIRELLKNARQFSDQGGEGETERIAEIIQREFEFSLILPSYKDLMQVDLLSNNKAEANSFKSLSLITDLLDSGDPTSWAILLGWVFTHNIGRVVGEPLVEDRYSELSRSWVDEWLLGKTIAGVMQNLGIDEVKAWRCISLIKMLISTEAIRDPHETAQKRAYKILFDLFKDHEAQNFLGVNRFQEVLWFNQESFNELSNWIFVTEIVRNVSKLDGVILPHEVNKRDGILQIQEIITDSYQLIKALKEAEKESGFRVDHLIEAAREKI
jgi:hypothetical protein